ncbi:ArsR/SmtB family transcription factor [Streptomyces anulatus]|uniref:ArsR/SmtB family transcription factor n=1 Tax=Streptomyces anulatus TaxID=1892 RepID=UPI0033C73349
MAGRPRGLATPSRLHILARLQEGPCSVSDLANAVWMEASACSHQLRLLRTLGLVTGERHGRSIIYALYDNYVAELLDQALFHVEHLRLGAGDTPAVAEHASAE